MSKTYIIDGNSLLFRSFYATYIPGREVMHTSTGIYTNALYLFNKMMCSIKSELTSKDRMIVCFDTGRKSFRTQKLESYKMNRKPVEPSLKAQMPLARELLNDLGILYIEKEGFEGDDLAGSLAYYASSKGDDVTLFTSDKDFLQLLVNNHVQIRFLRKGLSEVEVYTKDNIHEKLGFQADQVVDYKGLVGDTSDNIPGIKGVGEKTAIKLLDKYNHLEEIFAGLANDKSKMAKNILDNKETALFCRDIATIVTNLDVSEAYNKGLVKDYNYQDLLSFYNKCEFKKFASELIKKEESKFSLFGNETAEEENYDLDVKTYDSFKELDFKPTSLLVYTSNPNIHEAEIYGFYFSDGEKIAYIKVENLVNDDSFKKYLISEDKKGTYDYKMLFCALSQLNLPEIVNLDFDLLLTTYLLQQNVKQEKEACLEYYSYDVSKLSSDKVFALLCKVISNLKEKVFKNLDENGLNHLYFDLELPLSKVLAQMEIEGFPLSKDALEKVNLNFKEKLESIRKDIFTIVGHELNLDSPKQVAVVIYDELKLKRKGKNNSTNSKILEQLANIHPFPALLLNYRKYQKLVSSYTSSLGKYVQKDGKIHAIFNQALTATGRLSMSEPNLQNIAIRDEESKEIRKAFFYPNYEYQFLSLDYSQVELRMLASIANLHEMIEVFNNEVDIHTSTASKIFNVPVTEVTPLMRRKAKAVNFGIVYGISPWGLAEQLKISTMEANDIIRAFYNSYPGLKEFEDKIIAFAKTYGYVNTILNRRRYIEEINETNRNTSSFGERAAVNTVIQGSAADLIKVAMIKVNDFLKDYKTKMILQIHDELVFKVPRDEVPFIEEKLKSIMENCMKLNCKLEAEGSFGKNWFECK